MPSRKASRPALPGAIELRFHQVRQELQQLDYFLKGTVLKRIAVGRTSSCASTTGLFPEGDRLEAHDEVRPTAMRLPPRSFPASRPLLRMDLQSPGQDGQREAQLASRPALSGRHQTAPQTQGHAGQDGAPLANRFSSPGEASREYRLTSGCAAWSHYRLFSALRLPTVAYPACSPSLAPHRPPSGSRSDEKSGLA